MSAGRRRGGEHGPAVVAAALAITDAAYGFQQTAIVPAIPTIQKALHASPTWAAWLLSGYLITSAVATPLLGKVADRYGKRRLLVASLILFLVGSIGAALAPAMAMLIGFRAMQGAGGAVFPLSLAIIRDEFPEKNVAMGIGVLTSAFAAGMAVGFGISGVIVAALSWRWIFAFGAAAIAAAAALIPGFVPRSSTRARSALDLTGGLLLAGGLALLLLALTEGERMGWFSAPIVGAFVLGLALLAGWVAWDLWVPEPLLDLRVLTKPIVLYTNIASVLAGYVVFGIFFLIPFLVRGSGSVSYGFGVGPAAVGLYLLPAPVGQVPAGLLAAWLTRRFDPAWPFAGGLALCAAGSAALALWHGSPWLIFVLVFVLGAGFGLAIQVGSALIAQSVSATETAVAISLNSVTRRVGGSFGAEIAAALTATLTVAGGAPSEQAFVVAFWSCAAAAVVGVLFALAIRGHRL